MPKLGVQDLQSVLVRPLRRTSMLSPELVSCVDWKQSRWDVHSWVDKHNRSRLASNWGHLPQEETARWEGACLPPSVTTLLSSLFCHSPFPETEFYYYFFYIWSAPNRILSLYLLHFGICPNRLWHVLSRGKWYGFFWDFLEVSINRRAFW